MLILHTTALFLNTNYEHQKLCLLPWQQGQGALPGLHWLTAKTQGVFKYFKVLEAGKMDPLARAPALQPWGPGLDPQHPGKKPIMA